MPLGEPCSLACLPVGLARAMLQVATREEDAMPPHRCICQESDPSSPYPAGYDGCTPRTRVVAQPIGALLPVAGLLRDMRADAQRERPAASLRELIAADAVRRAIGDDSPRQLPAQGAPDSVTGTYLAILTRKECNS